MLSSASFPSPAHSTEYPSSSRNSLSVSAKANSSSTMRTVFILAPLARRTGFALSRAASDDAVRAVDDREPRSEMLSSRTDES